MSLRERVLSSTTANTNTIGVSARINLAFRVARILSTRPPLPNASAPDGPSAAHPLRAPTSPNHPTALVSGLNLRHCTCWDGLRQPPPTTHHRASDVRPSHSLKLSSTTAAPSPASFRFRIGLSRLTTRIGTEIALNIVLSSLSRIGRQR